MLKWAYFIDTEKNIKYTYGKTALSTQFWDPFTWAYTCLLLTDMW